MLSRKRANRRREDRPSLWRLPALPWRQLALGAMGCAMLAASVLALQWLLDQPIERITVAGSFQRISAIEVEKVVRAQIEDDGLVSVRLDDVRRALRELDWVDEASVQRSWPRSLRVQVLLWTIVPLIIVLLIVSLTGIGSHQFSVRQLVPPTI